MYYLSSTHHDGIQSVSSKYQPCWYYKQAPLYLYVTMNLFSFQVAGKVKPTQSTTNLPVGNLKSSQTNSPSRAFAPHVWLPGLMSPETGQNHGWSDASSTKGAGGKSGDWCFVVVKVIWLGGTYLYFSNPTPALKNTPVEGLLLKICIKSDPLDFSKCWFSRGGRVGLLFLKLVSEDGDWIMWFMLQIADKWLTCWQENYRDYIVTRKHLAWIPDRLEPEVQQGFRFLILNHNSICWMRGWIPITP